MAWGLLLCSNQTAPHLHPSSALPSQILIHGRFRGTPAAWTSRRWPTISGRSGGFLPFKGLAPCTAKKGNDVSPAEGWPSRRMLQAALWAAEAVYILWLFLLPYAPGDPVWAIKLDTINDIVGLSLNFFFILPLLNTDAVVTGLLALLQLKYWSFSTTMQSKQRMLFLQSWDKAYSGCKHIHFCTSAISDGPRQTASIHFSRLTSLCHLMVAYKVVSDEQCR